MLYPTELTADGEAYGIVMGTILAHGKSPGPRREQPSIHSTGPEATHFTPQTAKTKIAAPAVPGGAAQPAPPGECLHPVASILLHNAKLR